MERHDWQLHGLHLRLPGVPSVQVVRTKQKVRDFVFSSAPPKGLVAQITLALANNTIEVRTFSML